MAKLTETQLKSQNLAAAWQAYEDFRNGGEQLPAGAWLELYRAVKGQWTTSAR